MSIQDQMQKEAEAFLRKSRVWIEPHERGGRYIEGYWRVGTEKIPFNRNEHTVYGSREIAYEGGKALEALPALLDSLGEGSDVAEVHILDNAPIHAVIGLQPRGYLEFADYYWANDQWVRPEQY